MLCRQGSRIRKHMKKFVASVGIVTIGAAAAHAQYAPGLTPLETSKAWSVSADLRGFYDDNYLTVPKEFRQSTWGTEVSPSAAVNHSIADTLFSASYLYDLRWYATHPAPDTALDQSHQFNARLEHEFSERYKFSVNESICRRAGTDGDGYSGHFLAFAGGRKQHPQHGPDQLHSRTDRLLDLHLGYGKHVYAYQQKYETRRARRLLCRAVLRHWIAWSSLRRWICVGR